MRTIKKGSVLYFVALYCLCVFLERQDLALYVWEELEDVVRPMVGGVTLGITKHNKFRVYAAAEVVFDVLTLENM